MSRRKKKDNGIKKFLLAVFVIFLFCGGVLPAVEDYLDEVANSSFVLTFFNKQDSPEKLKKYIASVNGKLSPETVENYTSYILTYSKQYNVDYKLVASVISQESKYNVKAKSNKGAMGLMQIMPATAKGVAQKLKIEKYNLMSAKDNIQIGVKFLSMLHKEYNGDINLMLAHYNGGYRQARLYKTYRYIDFVRWLLMSGETYNYVKKVKDNYRKLSHEF